jgi:hypothetical protein
MNLTQAKAALRKLYGDKAMWRYNDKAPKGDERAELLAAIEPLRAAEQELSAKLDARRIELLLDPQYVELQQQWRAARREAQLAIGRAHTRRVTIGKHSMGFFMVEAEGDNWQEAIDAARAKAAK